MQTINKGLILNISVKLTHFKPTLQMIVKKFADDIATAIRILLLAKRKKNVFVIVNNMQ